MSVRKARHSGSWYSDSSAELSNQLGNWLDKAESIHSPARAIITPHAGYRYSGSCAAFAYKQICPEKVKRIFILGPSHRFSLAGCALTTAIKYRTPLYDLDVDESVNSELDETGYFEKMTLEVDEREHSIEMQLPYVAKVMESYRGNFTIVPILVGTLSPDKQSRYGKYFAKYLKNPENLFIISSDFCHWGQQFQYTYHDPTFNNIYTSIEHLDTMGMEAIESLNPLNFNDYLKKYGNTICGRHVIGTLLHTIQRVMYDMKLRPQLKFLKYSQSKQCLTTSDSSVSYAAGALVL